MLIELVSSLDKTFSVVLSQEHQLNANYSYKPNEMTQLKRIPRKIWENIAPIVFDEMTLPRKIMECVSLVFVASLTLIFSINMWMENVPTHLFNQYQ